MSDVPILHVELLADRNLQPAAALLDAGSGDLNEWSPLIESPRFSAFATRFPCFITPDLIARLPEKLLRSATATGCQALDKQSLYRSEAHGKPTFPDSALWLAGSWPFNPPVHVSSAQSASRILSLKLLHLVATDAETGEIEALFRQDPVLAYHLIRLVNSLGVSMARRISSFSQAILILGRQQLKRWLHLMLFAASRDDHRSAMLTAHVAVRARTTELAAEFVGLDRSAQEQAFMAGMFSLIGVLFGMPLADVLVPLKLPEGLASAVLHHDGPIGRLLKITELRQQEDQKLAIELDQAGIPISRYNELVLSAHLWMLGVLHDKRDEADD